MDWPFQKAEESNVYKTPLCRHIASMGWHLWMLAFYKLKQIINAIAFALKTILFIVLWQDVLRKKIM
jgi:hypothetical protein